MEALDPIPPEHPFEDSEIRKFFLPNFTGSVMYGLTKQVRGMQQVELERLAKLFVLVAPRRAYWFSRFLVNALAEPFVSLEDFNG